MGRGVWLDRGELDKIVERSAAQAAPQSAPHPAPQPAPPQSGGYPRGGDYDREHGHGGYRKPYKRKSWLEDIFD